MNRIITGLAALLSGCMLDVHTTPRINDWTELREGGEAIFNAGDDSFHLNYYGPETNHRDGAHDDIVFIAQYIPFEGYTETEFRVGDGDVRNAYGYRFRFNVINDNDGIIENNRVVVYWDKI